MKIKLSFIKISLLILSLFFVSAEPSYATDTPIDLDSDANVALDDRSSDEDESGACKYVTDPTTGDKTLEINDDVFNSDDILMGISDPSKCPLPGSTVFEDYPEVAGEFLFSGVICVTQSIILDAMFRVYCTILLWIYQILYSLMILYVMFYGIVIMFDLSNDPLKEAPKRLLKILFIFFMAVNAEFGFTWVHKSFTNFLNDFSDILTRIQPLYTDGGEAAYRWDDTDEEWILLDKNGDDWRPADNRNIPGWTGEYIAPEDYIPFRNPAMQWIFDKDDDHKLKPVFEDVTKNTLIGLGWEKACLLDFRYDTNSDALFNLEDHHRCHPKGWPVIPNVAPHGVYCVYDNFDDPADDYDGCELVPQMLYPPKLHIDSTDTDPILCDEENEPEKCRMPFQGILGKIDAMFNSVVGDDNAKGLGGMVVALILWGAGGGVFMALLLMSGILSMFVAFIQILWTYATSIMGLTFLMMLAPIFISFSLFKPTERLFRSWIGSLISFGFQPIIILGFIYVLSSATTFDRLSQLAKHEVSTVTYEFEVNDGSTKTSMDAPGFLEPLYELPSSDIYDSKLLTGVGSVDGLMKKEDRDKFREDGAKNEVFKLAAKLAGLNDDELDRINDLSKLQSFEPRVMQLINMFESTVESPHPQDTSKTRTVTGIDALKHYYDNEGVSWLNGPEYELITEFQNKYGFDDADGYPGEPANDEQPVGEFPTCKKYCPGFIPPYVATDTASINPDPGQCNQFCMYIYNNKQDMMSYLVGALLIWLILNVMTGAFMSRVPELAKRLANWQNMASQTPAIGGAGETNQSVSQGSELVEEGTGGFTVKERTGVYSIGSIWSLGIGPTNEDDGAAARPGAAVAGIEKLTRLGQTSKYTYRGKDGRLMIGEKPKESIWERNRVSSSDRLANEKEVKIAESLKKIREQYKNEGKGLRIEAEEVGENYARELVRDRPGIQDSQLKQLVEARINQYMQQEMAKRTQSNFQK